jgi:hypothetical protein
MPNTTISHRGTVRTNSPLVALYFRVMKGHRVTSRWHKPVIAWGPITFYSARWELRPTFA